MASNDSNDRRIRIDASHDAPRASNAAASPSLQHQWMLSSIAGTANDLATGEMPEVFTHHASELGEHLRSRYRALNRREDEFNAHSAQIENELRTARLVIREREVELTERRDAFDASLRELQERNADFVAATTALEAESTQQTTKHQVRVKQNVQSAEVWQQRLREMDRDERKLKAQLADIQYRQHQLDEQEQEIFLARRQLELEGNRKHAEHQRRIDSRLNQLRTQAEHLDQRRLIVERLHRDVGRMYREAIEIRICTEQLWAQMNDISPVDLTATISALRQKLSDQYDLTSQHLDQQRTEVQSLVNRLKEQESKLSTQRAELRGWASRRQEEFEQQAHQLRERELELERQSANTKHSQRHWRSEREQLEQEVRRLKRLSSTALE